MSRFFGTASDSESESEISEEEVPQRPTAVPTYTVPILHIYRTIVLSVYAQKDINWLANLQFFYLQFSDDEEEQKRIVRSAKEKRFEELKDLIRQIKNFKKIKDLSNMLTCFEDLAKAYQKALPVIVKEEKGITPRFYVQCLVEVETFLNELWEDRDGRKNLSKNNSKSLSTLRQKIRKYVKDFEGDIAKFKENPDNEVEDEEDADKSEESSDDEVGPAAFRKDPDARKTPKVWFKLLIMQIF